MSFDSGFVLGCKEYGLTKTITVEGVDHKVECLKCKGYALDGSLNYQMFETMNEGGSIEQTQSQFRCPKSNYVSETSSFNIEKKKVTKRFRKIYTKGVVDYNGVVTPHEPPYSNTRQDNTRQKAMVLCLFLLFFFLTCNHPTTLPQI